MKETTFSIQQSAKLIGFPGGKIKFFEWLRTKKYLLANNEPPQKYINLGWFIYIKKTIHKANPPFDVMAPRVTVKGLNALQRAVKKAFPPCKPCSDN